MTTTLVKSDKQTQHLAGMGQIVLVEREEIGRSVLGSCIGLALYHKRAKLGALGHIVLAEADGRSGPPGKFADTAIPEMLKQLADVGANKTGLVAKLAGGSHMFGGKGPIQIGDDNHAAVTKILGELNITIVGQNVGGTKGRKITFDGGTGSLTVEIAGEEPIVL